MLHVEGKQLDPVPSSVPIHSYFAFPFVLGVVGWYFCLTHAHPLTLMHCYFFLKN